MGVKGVRVGSADVRGAEGMKGGAVRGKKKGGGDGTGGARATHFRQHEGERGAKGSVLLPTLQTHSTKYRDITI